MSSSVPSSTSIDDDQTRREKLASILDEEDAPAPHVSGGETYEQGLAAILDDGDDDESPSDHTNGKAPHTASDDEEEAFLYPGADHAANIFDGEAEESGPSSTRSYGARMASILGSSEGDGEAASDGHGDDDDDEERFVYPNGDAPDGDGDDSLPSALPDRTLDSIRSMADSQHPGFKWRRGSSMADLSMSTSTTMTDLGSTAGRQRPARPPEYPTLSRLRSNVTPSSLRGQRSGPFGGAVSGFLGFGRSTSTFDISRSSITHSRTASSSSSLMGGGRGGSRLFPYGVDTPPSELSLSSSRDAAMAATHAEAVDPTAASSSLEPLTERGLFKWSALRKVAAFFQEGQRSGPSNVTASSGQSLPQDIGRQTVFAVAGGRVAIGTTTGHVLVFEFSQDFKCICGGPGAGEVTSLAFSADHASLAAGYSRGHVYIWDLAKPTAPSRTVLPVSRQDVASGKKEGHFGDSNVVHVAFVGARHTAIFTADDQGLAFYHSLGKILGVASNDTLRILGRYPERGSAKRRAPILSLAALPLGPVDHLADGVHFVALVTPQKLVIVGLKPNARTWYRKSAPLNDGSASGCGCAAWFPAFQDESSTSQSAPIIEPMLAYSFGTHLFVLRMKTKRVKVDPQANGNGDAAPPQYRMDIEFIEHPLSANSGGPNLRPIESIQWLSHELLLLVTSDDLRLVDLRVGRVTEREALGSTLAGLIRHPWCQNVAASARHSAHSVRVFRGKAFFLTTTQIVVGHLLAWTDRLLSLVSSGDFLSAIDLCRAYYLGQVPGSRVGLPDDDAQLREVVGGKLRELMSASARYAFAPERMTDGTHVTSDGRGVDRTQLFRDLARACAEACLALNDTTFLFGDLYDYYSDSGIEPLFVTELEPFILDGRLRQMPIPVTQRLVQSCKQAQDWGLAERLLWHVDPMCLDLDQALTLCREQRLVDASIYIYNAALSDFVSPIVELLEPVKKVVARRARGEDDDEHDGSDDEDGSAEDGALTSAYKLYSYLSVILSGRAFPSQDPLSPSSLADQAKRSVYGFIFSGHCVVWPPGAGAGGRIVLSVDEGEEERTYPYARLLLACDAEALLDALDVAFEDGFLDEDDDDDEVTTATAAEPRDGASPRITRQRIIDILLDVAHDAQQQNGDTSFASTPHTQDNLEEQRLFTSIFVARNLARYPQFVRLVPSTFDGVLRDLCLTGGDETREDRQLAAEALLSTRRPMKGKGAAAASPLAQLSEDELGMLEAAGFWRILKSAYRDVGNWGQLVALLLSGDEEDDGDDHAGAEAGGSLFAQLTDVLSRAQRQQQQRNKGQGSLARSDLDSMIIEATPRLVDLDASRTAQLVDAFFPDRHGDVLEVLSEQDDSRDQSSDDDSARRRQLSYLRSFIEQGEEDSTSLKASHLDASCRSTYVWLKARLEPWDLVRILVARQQQGDGDYFDLNIVVEAGKHHGGGAYDAVLWSLDRLGKPKEAFDALDDFVAQTALLMRKEAVEAEGTGVQNGDQHHESATPSYDTGASHGAPKSRMDELTDNLARASRLAVQICDSPSSSVNAEAMSVEDKWYRLLRSMVALMHHVGGGGSRPADSVKHDSSASAALDASRRIVEETLASMVTSLSTSSSSSSGTNSSTVSLPSLFRRLVASPTTPSDTITSSPQTFGEVRTIISAMMSACKLRAELLGVAQRLLSREEGDQFVLLARQRRRGWRGSSAGGAGAEAGARAGGQVTPPQQQQQRVGARGREGSLTATATMMATPTRARASSSLSSSGTPYAYHPAHRLASQPPTPGGAGATGMMTPLATPRANRVDRKGKARSLSFRHDEEEENGASRSVDDYFGPSVSTSSTYRGSSGSPEQSFSMGSSPTALRGMGRRRGGLVVDEDAIVSSSPREWTTEGVVEAAPVAKAVRVRLGPAPAAAVGVGRM